MSKGQKPDYRLAVIQTRADDSEKRGNVGAGWIESDGRISIQLDACIVLDGSQALVLALFPEDYVKRTPAG